MKKIKLLGMALLFSGVAMLASQVKADITPTESAEINAGAGLVVGELTALITPAGTSTFNRVAFQIVDGFVAGVVAETIRVNTVGKDDSFRLERASWGVAGAAVSAVIHF